jgi:hypothetical protein
MKQRNLFFVLSGIVIVLVAAGAFHFARQWRRSKAQANIASPRSAISEAGPASQPQGALRTNSPNLEQTSDFRGTLTPGGSPESAGRERTFLVSYQVVFLRKAPTEALAEESLSYRQLQERDPDAMPPCLFYGESVAGKYDPARPEAIAVRATINGKEEKGYVDARKVWLEPPLDPVDSPRYMSLKDATDVTVVPDATSPAVLSLLQGEVVEAVGQLNFQGRQWIQARFNDSERPRYGFLPGSDVRALTSPTVNQSAVTLEEIPKQIRGARLAFSSADRQTLSQKGFYVEALPPRDVIDVDDMADSYRDVTDGAQYFITSDLFLHSYHLIFDRMLQDLEEKRLLPPVTRMAGNIARATEKELQSLSPSAPADLREAMRYDLFYFSVAAKLFDPNFAVAEQVRPQAEAFVSKIRNSGGELPSSDSSQFGDEDFTQYKIRGHYEKSKELRRYFQGMMWFGRQNFLLADKRKTLAAILIPSLAEKARETRAVETLDALLAYLIGRQDKYNFAGYQAVNRKIFGTETPSPSQLTAKLDENLSAFQGMAARDLPGPQIVSVQTGIGHTQEDRLAMVRGFKFLGQRYTLDAFFMSQLTSPSVGTDNNPRNLPSAMDVMLLLGSTAAAEVQQQSQKEHHWENYGSQIAKLAGIAGEQLAKRASFYDQWLSGVSSLFEATGSKQLFALGKPWQYKNLNAAAASWTELKHDTILYSEQSTAESGGGDEFEIPAYAPPEPKGYIEPNPLFFRQLNASIEDMLGRLKGADAITEEYLDKFSLFRDIVGKAETIAQKEVSGDAITREDYLWIENLRESFDRALLLPRDAEVIQDPTTLQMALIADVATDAVDGRVLEVATGTPQRIIVLVKDAFGGTRLTAGYVYSWFEFPSGKRWSDSEWKRIIYAKDDAGKKQKGIESPSWYAVFHKNAGAGAR